MTKVKFVKVDPNAVLPKYMSEAAAGMDLVSVDRHLLLPGQRKLFSTGLKVALPVGTEGQIRPRSGLALKHGVTVLNAPGTIDADYRSIVGVLLINHGESPYEVKIGERIAQFVVASVKLVDPVEVEDLDTTLRGDGGFGSTGTQTE